jgi:hypothetical protein
MLGATDQPQMLFLTISVIVYIRVIRDQRFRAIKPDGECRSLSLSFNLTSFLQPLENEQKKPGPEQTLL